MEPPIRLRGYVFPEENGQEGALPRKHAIRAIKPVALATAMVCLAPGARADDAPPVKANLLIDQLEGRISDGADFKWETEGWVGPDEYKAQFRSEGLRTHSGGVDDGQQELFFSKPVSTIWSLQAGGRYDLDSRPGRGWGAIGIEGIAPRSFHIAATAYAGGRGAAAKVRVADDLLITNRLILEPEGKLNAYSENDPAREIGSGFSDLDAGLRLRYEFSRQFAPYLGVVWRRKFGKTADLAQEAHEPTGEVRFAVGLRSWF